MAQLANPQPVSKGTSKNQRASGPKVERHVPVCPAGHEIQYVRMVPIKGRAGMQAWCPCD